ncbi:MAG: hypothetical protein QOE97_3827 [Pseudonocardiales bacterium]|nr:hypothetical protein [Pseudonocardiales bacterium]
MRALHAKYVVITDVPLATLPTGSFLWPGIVYATADADVNERGFRTEPNWAQSSPEVLSVGETLLQRDTSTPRGWDERALATSASGCATTSSPVVYQDLWGTNAVCSGRAFSDIAATTGDINLIGVGQTEPAPRTAPTFAAAIVVAAAALSSAPNDLASPVSDLYWNARDEGLVTDVTAMGGGASNDPTGQCTTRLCVAQPGWDGPSGVGVLNGPGALEPTWPAPHDGPVVIKPTKAPGKCIGIARGQNVDAVEARAQLVDCNDPTYLTHFRLSWERFDTDKPYVRFTLVDASGPGVHRCLAAAVDEEPAIYSCGGEQAAWKLSGYKAIKTAGYKPKAYEHTITGFLTDHPLNVDTSKPSPQYLSVTAPVKDANWTIEYA